MAVDAPDWDVRLAAFAFLGEQMRLRGADVLPYELLRRGFPLGGQVIRLVGPQAFSSLPRSSFR